MYAYTFKTKQSNYLSNTKHWILYVHIPSKQNKLISNAVSVAAIIPRLVLLDSVVCTSSSSSSVGYIIRVHIANAVRISVIGDALMR